MTKQLTTETLAERYQGVQTAIAALEMEKKELAAELKAAVGDYGTLELSNGMKVTKYLSEFTSYPVGLVRALMGDSADNFLRVDRTKLDNYVNAQLTNTTGAEKTSWARVMTHLASKKVVDRVSEGLRVS